MMQIYVRIAQVISILMKLIHQMEKDIILNENITHTKIFIIYYKIDNYII